MTSSALALFKAVEAALGDRPIAGQSVELIHRPEYLAGCPIILCTCANLVCLLAEPRIAHFHKVPQAWPPDWREPIDSTGVSTSHTTRTSMHRFYR
jgi:hypothetical protein